MASKWAFRGSLFSCKGKNRLLLANNGLEHLAPSSLLLIDRLYCQLSLLLSHSQSFNFTIITVTSLLAGLMAMIPNDELILWFFDLWTIWKISFNNQLFWTGTGRDFINFVLVTVLDGGPLIQDVLLVSLHHEKTVLPLFNIENLLLLFFDLLFHLSVLLVSLDQFLDLAFDFW